MKAILEALNCGAGHLEFHFDTDRPDDVERAKNTIQDMLQRGYTILVTDAQGETHRVHDFDPKQGVYYVEPPVKKKPGKQRKSVPAAGTTATAVGRTGGG